MTFRTTRLYKTFKIRYNIDRPCCFKCGEVTDKIDMHHVDSATKCFNPSRAKNFAEYYAETEKCVPLCKECHKDIHKLGRHVNADVTIEWLNA